MTSWANQFDDLKNQFVARSKERLVAIESLLSRLQAAPGDEALLKQAMQHFHWLAGSGGTYGFDDITSWGTYGEELCDYLLKLQSPISPEDHEKLVTAFRTVSQLFAAQSTTMEQANRQNPAAESNLPQSHNTTPAQSYNSNLQSTQAGSTPGQFSSASGYPQDNKPAGRLSSLFGSASLSGVSSAGGRNRQDEGSGGGGAYGQSAGNAYGNQYPQGSPAYGTPENAGFAQSASPGFAQPENSENAQTDSSTYKQKQNFSQISSSDYGQSDSNPRGAALPPGTGNYGQAGNPRGVSFPSGTTLGGQTDSNPNGPGMTPEPYGQAETNPKGTGLPPGTAYGQGEPAARSNPPQLSGSNKYKQENRGSAAPNGANPPPITTTSAANSYTGAHAQSPLLSMLPGSSGQQYAQGDSGQPYSPGQPFAPGTSAQQYASGQAPYAIPGSAGNPDDVTRLVGTPGPAAAPVMEVRSSSRLSHIPTNKKFAVFVDSNLSNLQPIKASLEERGLIVEGIGTASEAKGLFAERLPDVLIVGAPLIDNNGYELVEYLRGLEAGHKPIVIVLAQQAVFLDKVYAIRSGADAFFEYPSELTDLQEKLNALLDRDKNEHYKILSVDDDPDMANFLKLTLQSAGYTVMHIADPKTFEEHFLSFEPDLVMLDVLLGDMTGFEIAKYIRQSDRFATLPIVFLTTQNKLHQHIRSAIAGGDEHLIKPVAPQLLIATIASRLERARSLKRLIDRDGLTRCLNFGSFMERAEKLALGDGYRSAPAMMMIDVDNMKKTNEKWGFAAGDRVISNIANMLLKGFRNTDLIARFGNDQFAIVLEHLNPPQLQSLSSQVLGAISGTPQLIKGRPISVTCSAGVAILEQGMSVQDWLDAAQDSLRKAKDAGGNRAIVKPSSRA